jgi:hypothetical protein
MEAGLAAGGGRLTGGSTTSAKALLVIKEIYMFGLVCTELDELLEVVD